MEHQLNQNMTPNQLQDYVNNIGNLIERYNMAEYILSKFNIYVSILRGLKW